MGRFKGFKPSKKDSIHKRAALALVHLLKAHGIDAFVSWVELFAVCEGIEQADVDAAEVKRRLRSRPVCKLLLREMGYGWTCHPADRSMIRATMHGRDSVPCAARYLRRASTAAENAVAWIDKTVGNPRLIVPSPEVKPMLNAIKEMTPRLRGLLSAVGVEATIKAAG